MADFVSSREPNDAMVAALADRQRLLKDYVRTEVHLVIGTKPSWTEDDKYAGIKKEKYVSLLKSGDSLLSTIFVMRHIPLEEKAFTRDITDHFWFGPKHEILPVVTDQFTHPGYYGCGFNTLLIHASNEFYRDKLQLPLYSALHFAMMLDRRGPVEEAKQGSRRVWEKLEDKCLAQRLDWYGIPRWRCL